MVGTSAEKSAELARDVGKPGLWNHQALPQFYALTF
jgi:hypothetical protein